jgi:hypothetical protein
VRKIVIIIAFIIWLPYALAEAVPIYIDGVSPALSSSPPGTYDMGIHLVDYIGPTQGSAISGTNLDGQRVFFHDNKFSTDPATATPFNLLVWRFETPKDSVRLYTHQDHLSSDGLADTDFEAQDVMEYSVWGCNGAPGQCTTQAEWTLLSDVIGFDDVETGKPTYTFSGTEPAAIFRGGSEEYGLVNAYTRDYTFDTPYNYYGIRSSTISFIFEDADPELDALAAFNRIDVPLPEPGPEPEPNHPSPDPVPEPSTLFLLGSGLAGAILFNKNRKA